MFDVKHAPEGPAYLNLACGGVYYAEWNNCDQLPLREVVSVDLRGPLPWPAASFDAIYSSHALEHLRPGDALALLQRILKVGKPGAVIRIVVPDLEAICRSYLDALQHQVSTPTDEGRRRHEWMTIELLDQMVRDRPGGRMAAALREGDFDEETRRTRFGDDARYAGEVERVCVDRNGRSDEPGSFARERNSLAVRLWRRWARFRSRFNSRGTDPRFNGEGHKWMYDRLSLARLLDEAGFVECRVCDVYGSAIPHWVKYNLDVSRFGDAPRKPDSLYIEARIPC